MNEFQAIFTELLFFVLRFAIPALIIYGSIHLVRRIRKSDEDTNDPGTVH